MGEQGAGPIRRRPSSPGVRRPPDPLGKRALFWVPGTTPEPGERGPRGTVRPALGKEALYSDAPPNREAVESDNPIAERGFLEVECSTCRTMSRIGLLDLVIYQFPVGIWLPWRKFSRYMTCPACRRRAWTSVSLHRD
jgi:hypothetical protein